MYITDTQVSGLGASMKYSGLPMQTVPSHTQPLDGDFERAKRLAYTPAGSGHDNFLNGVTVHFYIQASNKFWVEMQRYHFMDFVSSQSTMHRLKFFDLDNQYNEYVDPRIKDIMKELQAQAVEDGSSDSYLRLLYSNPAGFEVGAYMVTNYRQLKTIYKQRKTHKLPEWKVFCAWVEGLPYAHLITNE